MQEIGRFLKLDKLENMTKKKCIFKKKRFDLFKSPLYENGKAESMPVAAGRFVYSFASPSLSGRQSGFNSYQLFRFNLHLSFPFFEWLPFKASKVFNFINARAIWTFLFFVGIEFLLNSTCRNFS